jgi:hypothetical protein
MRLKKATISRKKSPTTQSPNDSSLIVLTAFPIPVHNNACVCWRCTCRGRHPQTNHSSSFVLIAKQPRRVPSEQQVADFCRRGSQRRSFKLMRMMIFWLLLLRKCGKSRPLGEFKRVARSLERGRRMK